jgi:hypothetical protein
MNKDAKRPDWWPKNPYPESVFVKTQDDYAKIVPDPETRTGLSGMLGREFWDIASKYIWEAVESQLKQRDKEIERLKEERDGLAEDLDALAHQTTYQGNTVSYIYDKAKLYGKQVMIAGRLLRKHNLFDEFEQALRQDTGAEE